MPDTYHPVSARSVFGPAKAPMTPPLLDPGVVGATVPASPAGAPAATPPPCPTAAGASLVTVECGDFFKSGNATFVCSGVSRVPGREVEVSWYSYEIVNGSAQPGDMGRCTVIEWLAKTPNGVRS